MLGFWERTYIEFAVVAFGSGCVRNRIYPVSSVLFGVLSFQTAGSKGKWRDGKLRGFSAAGLYDSETSSPVPKLARLDVRVCEIFGLLPK